MDTTESRQPVRPTMTPRDRKLFRIAVRTMKIWNRAYRDEVYHLLDMHGPLCVTDIYVRLRIEQSVASQALRDLRKLKLVTPERRGKQIYYSANSARYELLYALADRINRVVGA